MAERKLPPLNVKPFDEVEELLLLHFTHLGLTEGQAEKKTEDFLRRLYGFGLYFKLKNLSNASKP